MIKNATQDSRFLQIETPFGTNQVFLQSIEGTEGFSQLFEYQLVLLTDANSPLDVRDVLGKTVTVSMFGQAGRTRYIHGYVSCFDFLGQDDSQAAYSAKIVPWLWFLTQRRDCRIFQRDTVPSIIAKVFQQWGFLDFDRSFLLAEYPTLEYCVQYRETDFDFVSRLMEEYGIFYYFRHEAGKHTLVLADDRSAYFELPDPQLDYYSAGTHDGVAQILSWNRQVAFCSGKVSLTDFDFQQPDFNLLNDRKTQLPFSLMEHCEVFDYPGRFVNKNDGRALSRIRLESLESRHNRVRASSNVQAIVSGGMFSLRYHPQPAEVGVRHVVIQTKLKAEVDGFRSSNGGGGGSGPAYHVEFICIPAKTLFRPERVTPKALMLGCQTAVVTGPEGEEIYTDEFGRVKVKFHWDRLGPCDDRSSCWVRVSQPHAGAGWGHIDLPRVGEEVIVDFLEGDPDRPIIVGRVYNGCNRVPFRLPQNKTISGYKSKSYKEDGKNEMLIDDTAGEEKIVINAQKDMNTSVANDQTLFVGNDRIEEVTTDDSLKVGGDKTTYVGGASYHSSKGTMTHVSDTEVFLGCGGSYISITPEMIEIGSKLIKIVGLQVMTEASLVVSNASAQNIIKGGTVIIN